MRHFYIPVASYQGVISLHTWPHGARHYHTEEGAKAFRSDNGQEDNWRILELTIDAGDSPAVRWCD